MLQSALKIKVENKKQKTENTKTLNSLSLISKTSRNIFENYKI